MREYIEIGSAPYDEECAQVGDPDYREKALAECNRYIARLREVIGKEPEGARLAIKSFNHDFGTYYEVVCYYDTDNPIAIDYAYDCESNSPANWIDKPAKKRGVK